MSKHDMTPRVRLWHQTAEKVALGVSRGLALAQRHERPSVDVVQQCVSDAVLVELCELYDLGEAE